MTKRDDLIAKRAHEIWEQEGRPHGRDEEHWHRAAEAIAAEEGGAEDGATETAESAPKAAKKPRAAKAAGADPAPKRKPAEPAAAPGEKAPRAPRKPKAKPAG